MNIVLIQDDVAATVDSSRYTVGVASTRDSNPGAIVRTHGRQTILTLYQLS